MPGRLAYGPIWQRHFLRVLVPRWGVDKVISAGDFHTSLLKTKMTFLILRVACSGRSICQMLSSGMLRRLQEQAGGPDEREWQISSNPSVTWRYLRAPATSTTGSCWKMVGECQDQYFDRWAGQTQLLDSPCAVPLRIRRGDSQHRAPPMPLVLPHWLPPMKRTSLVLLFKLTKHSSEPLPCQEMFSWEKILCNEVSKQPLTMFLRALSQRCRESAQCRENIVLGIRGLYSGQSSLRSLRKEPGIWLQIEIQILALAFSSCMT